MDVPEKHTGFTHFALEITDVEAVKRQLGDNGIVITETVGFDGMPSSVRQMMNSLNP